MADRRQAQRELTLKTGTIKSIDIGSHIECAILDISTAGARILLPAGVEAPETFDLAMDPDGRSNCCRVVWRSGNSIGVSFQTKVQI
jgi:PilZ domain